MHDVLISWIRTTVAALLGAAFAFIGTRGVEVDAEYQTALILAVGAVAVSLYQGVVRLAEARWPVVGVLLGVKAAPSYPGRGDHVADDSGEIEDDPEVVEHIAPGDEDLLTTDEDADAEVGD